MSQVESPDRVEQYKDHFNAKSSTDHEDFYDDSVECWVSDDETLLLAPEDSEPLARGMIASMETSPDEITEKEYTDSDGDTFDLVEIGHESTSGASNAMVKHYYQKPLLEEIAAAFDMDVETVQESITSRFDRMSGYPGKLDVPECDYCLVISPFMPKTPQI